MSRPGEARFPKQQTEQQSDECRGVSLADALNNSENISAWEQQDTVPAVTAFVALRSQLVLDGLIA